MKFFQTCFGCGIHDIKRSESHGETSAVTQTGSSVIHSATTGGGNAPYSNNGAVAVSQSVGLIPGHQKDVLFQTLGSPYLASRGPNVQTQLLQAAPDSIATLLLDLRNLKWLGQGHFGIVYRGEWHGTDVAVKIIADQQGCVMTEYALEAVRTRQLNHPNIAQIQCCTVLPVNNHLDDREASSLQYGGSCKAAGVALSEVTLGCPSSLPQTVIEPTQNPSNKVSVGNVLQQTRAHPGEYLTRIVLEFCDKGSLDRAVMAGVFEPGGDWSRRAKLRALLRTAKEIAQGMWHLHQCSIIHGDLTANNVLLKSSRQDRRGFIAKVSDYGLTKFCVYDRKEKSDQWGGLAHLAPEVIEGQLNKGSDVYAFGMLLWQMVTAQQPFQGMGQTAVLLGVREGLRPVWPEDCFSPLRKLGQQCLSQDFVDRPTFECIIKQLSQLEWQLKQSSAKSRPTTSQPETTAAHQEVEGACLGVDSTVA